MKHFLAPILLCCLGLCAFQWVPTVPATHVSGGGGTITLVHHTTLATQQSCSTSCPAFTIASTTAGNVGILGMTFGHAGDSISSVTGCGTWALDHGTSGDTRGTDASGVASTDLAYNLSLTGSCTSITITVSVADGNADYSMSEYHYTGSSMSLDVGGNRTNSPASANYSGVALTLGGTNDVILQVARPSTAVTACSGWTTPADFTNGDGYCGKITSSGTAVAWTATSSTAALSALALKGN